MQPLLVTLERPLGEVPDAPSSPALIVSREEV
jgi:hypothetical protein